MADRTLEVAIPSAVTSVTDPNGSDMQQQTDTLTCLIATLESSLRHVQGSQPGSHQSRSSLRSAFSVCILVFLHVALVCILFVTCMGTRMHIRVTRVVST